MMFKSRPSCPKQKERDRLGLALKESRLTLFGVLWLFPPSNQTADHIAQLLRQARPVADHQAGEELFQGPDRNPGPDRDRWG